MKKLVSSLAVMAAATAVQADETRQLDAHEHGVGELNIAIDGNLVAMELHAPGADIVGFEYEAKSEADKAAIDAALETLSKPFDLFTLPAAAGCEVKAVEASLESEAEHEDAHGHEEHGEDDHDDHGHEDHAEKDHDDHAHDDHGHDDHAEEAGDSHTEFHAEYTLECATPDAIATIGFPYFELFENALELEVQMVTAAGARKFEVEREAPDLSF